MILTSFYDMIHTILAKKVVHDYVHWHCPKDCCVKLRTVKWVTLWWFLFGAHPYQPTLDFAFSKNERLLSAYDVISRKRASKRHRQEVIIIKKQCVCFVFCFVFVLFCFVCLFVCLFLRFLYWTESSPTFKVRGLQVTINFSLV